MQERPTTLVIPGGPTPDATGPAAGPPGGRFDSLVPDALSGVAGDAGAALVWALPIAVVLLGLWVATNGRRRRRIDPRELAFRRVAQAQGWSRAQVRALRRAASAAGLGSPVGLALSPSLTAGVLARSGSGENRAAHGPAGRSDPGSG